MSTISRRDLHRFIDRLPESSLAEVARFLEFIFFKLGEKPDSASPYVPVALGGLWQGLTITDEDIMAVRQEMWRGFGEEVE